ncbi:MAG TPA: rRNA maturation RNase YbeY [Saprospiraceae bacterium]|nr:rRNA maturation RNase YbeY [Saprospiraceae bacterium]
MQFPLLPLDSDKPCLTFHAEDVDFEVPQESALAAWLLRVAEAEGHALGEISYIFCSDEHLRHINVQYLQHDYYTDIITFPYEADGRIAGDMFISTERVADNAQSNGADAEHEMRRVMVHGLLHLMGYGDKTSSEMAQMRSKEDFYLALWT